MTPQEELFADLFNGYKTKPSVNEMSDIELRAHREELMKIAFEAKAYTYAVDEILKERKPKGLQGFSRSLNIDETTTNAINTIKEKQKRLTKTEKIQAGLEKLGISSTDAAKLISAGNILARLKDKASQDIMTDKAGLRSPLSQENGFTIKPKPIENKPIFNPFTKE